jgi:hypothetical protein
MLTANPLWQGFIDSAWDTGQAINISGGYPAALVPNQKAGRMMIRDLQRHGVSGLYSVLHDGDGLLSFSMDVKRVWRPAPGRAEVQVELTAQMNNGLFLTVDRTNPLDPVRNIRVFTPGFGGRGGGSSSRAGYRGTPFHPAFIETLRRYRVLRFMDWQATNGISNARSAQQRYTETAPLLIRTPFNLSLSSPSHLLDTVTPLALSFPASLTSFTAAGRRGRLGAI